MRSYRSKLQSAFVLLGLIAIGATGWESSVNATSALRDATYERLTAIAQTKRRQVERYFHDLGNHVLALSSDETTIAALEELHAAWSSIPPMQAGSGDALRAFYRDMPEEWFPTDPRTTTLQEIFLARNPHSAGLRQQLLTASGAGRYGDVHARYHPTLQRYQSAFGFYDTFLIDASDGRILYTVLKEIDLGMRLTDGPYRETSLARIFQRAMTLETPESYVVEDYKPYPPSQFVPAAFFAAPIWRRGAKIGVLAIQVSVDELNRVMTSGGKWREEGLGETGQAYLVGPDRRLRSDLRTAAPGSSEGRTAILSVEVPDDVADGIRGGKSGTLMGRDFRNRPVLRSLAPLTLPELEWTLVAEIGADEALAPVRTLQSTLLMRGAVVAILFFIAATVLSGLVTRPLVKFAETAGRLGRRDFEAKVPVRGNDEIGQLAVSFNQMAEDLRRTTVSKEELEVLAGRLISAQEDERARIARELHDDLTQRIAAIAIELGRIQRTSPAETDLERVREQVIQVSQDIHGLSRRLHPSTLDDVGLVAAIEAECRSFFERGGAPVEFSADGNLSDISRDTQLALYRIIQEALRNVHLHADASDVAVRLSRTPDAVEAEVRDNGRGFDANDRRWRRGVGLASMEERASLLGGQCTIVSKLNDGTQIRVSLPIRASDEEAESPVSRRP
jgi:signal transduction histidine kinase